MFLELLRSVHEAVAIEEQLITNLLREQEKRESWNSLYRPDVFSRLKGEAQAMNILQINNVPKKNSRPNLLKFNWKQNEVICLTNHVGKIQSLGIRW